MGLHRGHRYTVSKPGGRKDKYRCTREITVYVKGTSITRHYSCTYKNGERYAKQMIDELLERKGR